MKQSQSKYDFFQQASLSQKLAYKQPEFSQYAGSDPKTSLAIARINIFIKHEILDAKDEGVILLLDLLNEQRKAFFATSEKTNEITKLGLQLPKSENIISDFDEEE